MRGLGTAAQHRGVAGLQAQRGRVHRYIRARFIDDTHHAERHPHTPDLDSRGAIVHSKDSADGVGESGHFARPFDHAVNALIIQ